MKPLVELGKFWGAKLKLLSQGIIASLIEENCVRYFEKLTVKSRGFVADLLVVLIDELDWE